MAAPGMPVQCSISADPPLRVSVVGYNCVFGITVRGREGEAHSSFATALPENSAYSRRMFTRCPAFSRICPRISPVP